MTVTISTYSIISLVVLTNLMSVLILNINFERKGNEQIRKKIAQFNVLRLWLNHYFDKIPSLVQEKARIELAEIIINNEGYEEIKKWYNFFFNSGH